MMTKAEIRKINKEKRKLMTEAEVKEKSLAIAKTFLDSEIYKNAKTIMVYMPIGNEVDTKEIIASALSDGKRIIVPVTDAKTGEITPCEINENTAFEKGAFSVFEPVEKVPADPPQIDVVLVPGIAFDKKGGRIGFGKGCYDRFLKKMEAFKIGLCYDFQLCDEIEAESHDIKMDFVITEKVNSI
ncbi:MAG: 5-formyltetrahydrofolate cyclo-ligase [Clostridia bacterium]|nr:5-formyltetrahydrofolate cyclo-ligase [Clostridia bacterium]